MENIQLIPEAELEALRSVLRCSVCLLYTRGTGLSTAADPLTQASPGGTTAVRSPCAVAMTALPGAAQGAHSPARFFTAMTRALGMYWPARSLVRAPEPPVGPIGPPSRRTFSREERKKR